MRFMKKMVTALAAASASIALATAPHAAAAPAGNIVTIADSYGANPEQASYYLGGAFPALNQPGTPFTGGCQQAHNNWPGSLSRQTGAPVSNWSCAALTSNGIMGRVEGAIRSGDLHPGTRSVVISVGMNDFGPPGARNGYDVGNHQAIRDAHMREIRNVSQRIRAVNPGINIVIAGFPQVANAAGGVCVLNVISNLPMGLPLPVVRDVESFHRQNQLDAANANGLRFVDVREQTRGHDTCAADNQRYVSGIVDTTAPHWNMFLHPTDLGNERIAQAIRPVV